MATATVPLSPNEDTSRRARHVSRRKIVCPRRENSRDRRVTLSSGGSILDDLDDLGGPRYLPSDRKAGHDGVSSCQVERVERIPIQLPATSTACSLSLSSPDERNVRSPRRIASPVTAPRGDGEESLAEKFIPNIRERVYIWYCRFRVGGHL